MHWQEIRVKAYILRLIELHYLPTTVSFVNVCVTRGYLTAGNCFSKDTLHARYFLQFGDLRSLSAKFLCGVKRLPEGRCGIR